MMRSIVIYYSKTGKTDLVAKTIKKEIGAHVKEVTDYTNERTLLEYMFPTVIDSASINPRKIDVNYYETIFIGTPVWLGSITPAIKKIIDNMDFKNKNVILFNTMKSVGGDIAMKRMAKYVRRQHGNIIGAFTIKTDGSRQDIIASTQEALRDFNLT